MRFAKGEFVYSFESCGSNLIFLSVIVPGFVQRFGLERGMRNEQGNSNRIHQKTSNSQIKEIIPINANTHPLLLIITVDSIIKILDLKGNLISAFNPKLFYDYN